MKTFQSKNLHDSHTVGLLKGLTLLFLGASVAVLATYGLTIDPSINNSVQYIQKIILTSDGTASGATGVVLDGGSGNAYFAGKMGIGVANPSSNLEIASGGNISFSVNSGLTYINMKSSPSMLNGFTISESASLGFIANFDGDLLFLAGPLFGTNGDITITTGGRVGIETTTPSATLDVNGTTELNGNVGIGTGAGTYRLDVNGSGNFVGNIIVNGYISASKEIFAVGSGYFLGKVGIGTLTPTQKLDVQGSGNFAGNLILNQNDLFFKDTNHGIGYYWTTSKPFGSNTGLDGPVVYGWDGGALGETNGSGSVVLRWLSNGKVGIGTSNPQATLNVSGDFRASHDSARLDFAGGSASISNSDLGTWQCPNDGVMKGLRVSEGGGYLQFEILCSSD